MTVKPKPGDLVCPIKSDDSLIQVGSCGVIEGMADCGTLGEISVGIGDHLRMESGPYAGRIAGVRGWKFAPGTAQFHGYSGRWPLVTGKVTKILLTVNPPGEWRRIFPMVGLVEAEVGLKTKACKLGYFPEPQDLRRRR